MGAGKGTQSRMQLIAVKPMGALGRVIIPAEVRKTQGLGPGASIGIYVDQGRVVLQALRSAGRCALCGDTGPTEKVLTRAGSMELCPGCIQSISKARKLYRKLD